MSEALKQGYRQTEVGVIPEDWGLYLIKDICDLVNGRGFKPYEWTSVGLPIIRIQNLNGSEDFNFFSGNYHPKIFIENGDLLFAWSGSRGTSFGPHIWKGSDALLNYHTWKIKVKKIDLDKEFFYYKLKELTYSIEADAHGASALVHTQKNEVEKLTVSLPPLPEQRAIASALADVDALLDSLEELLTKKRQLKQAAMQELLTGKTRLEGFEGEWEEKQLGEIIATPVTDGPHLTPKFISQGIPFLSVNNIVNCRIDFSELRYISEKDHLEFSKKCQPRYNDILLGKAASIGKIAIIKTKRVLNIWSPLALIRSNSSNSPDFIYYALQGEKILKQITLFTNTSSQGNIGMGDIERLLLHLPAFAEQKAIAAILSEMDAELEALQERLSKTRDLKQGMMQELLTGRTRLI